MKASGIPIARVVVAAGPPLLLEALEALLAQLASLQVIDRCRSFKEVLAAVQENAPEAVVVMPPLDGYPGSAGLVELRRYAPDIAVVWIVQEHVALDTVRDLVHHRGIALVSSVIRAADLQHIVPLARGGFTIVGGDLCNVMFHPVTGLGSRPGSSIRANLLTEREKDILHALACGADEHSIANVMGVSVRTVQSCFARARDKLGAIDRTHAVALAIEAGLIRGPPVRMIDR